MSKVSLRHIGSTTRIILGCGIVISAALLAAKFFFFSPLGIWGNHEAVEFSFAKVVNNPELWTGPKTGERFDSTRLKDRSGKTLASSTDVGQPIMVVAVNPGCGMCSQSANQMRQVRDAIAKNEVKYYLVAFLTPGQSPDNFFKYLDTFHVDVPTFVGSEKEGNTQDPLTHMLVPVHFLLDGDSIIRGVWPGTSSDKSRRDRMASQIVSETLEMLPHVTKAPAVSSAHK
jgi:hypothetical protein